MGWAGETGTNHLHTQRHLFEYQLEAAQFLGGWSGPSLAGTTGDRCFAQAGGGAQPELGVGSGQWAAQGLPVSIPHGTPPQGQGGTREHLMHVLFQHWAQRDLFYL